MRYLKSGICVFLIALSANVCAQTSDQGSTEIEPSTVLNWYLQTVINRNVVSAQRLNDYLRLRLNGAEAFNLSEVKTRKTLDDPRLQQNLDSFMNQLARSVSSTEFKAFKEQYLDSFRIQTRLLQEAQCQINGQPELRQSGGRFVALIDYECNMTNVDFEKIALDKSRESLTMEDSLAFQQRRNVALNQAQGNRVIRARAVLYSSLKPKVWYIEQPDSLITPLLKEGLGLE